MRDSYDVIVVGGRVAGAATASQLARAGLDVLVAERAAPGADTSSTHALLGPATEMLRRWGLARTLMAEGTPPVETSTFHYEGSDPIEFDLSSRPLMAPRRRVIDAALATRAGTDGADVVFGSRVTGLVRSDVGDVTGVVLQTGADARTVRARLVVGADGIGSFVARRVGAVRTHTSAESSASVYGYFDGPAADGYHWYFSKHAAAGLIPTNEGLTCVFASTSSRRFAHEIRRDLASGFTRLLGEAAPRLPDGWDAARRVGRYRSYPGAAGFLRRSWGGGWALVGDAGAFTDPMSAHGMTAALRDSVLCADAIVAALDDPTCAPEAWMDYEATRDRLTRPFIDAIDDVAAFRHDMKRVQTAHIAMSKATEHEVAELDTRGWGAWPVRTAIRSQHSVYSPTTGPDRSRPEAASCS